MEAGVSPKRRDSGVRPASRLYSLLLFTAALYFIPAGVRAAVDAPLDTLLWIVLIAAANLLTLPMSTKMQLDVSLSAPVAVAASVILVTPLALLVNFLGFTNRREWRRETPIWVILFNRSQMALAAGAASWIAAIQPFGLIVGTLAAALLYNFVNVVAVAIFVRLRRRLELSQAAKSSAAPFPHFMVDFGLVSLLALFVVIAYGQVGPLAVLLLVLPLWLGYSALRSAREAEDRAEQLAARVRELETLHGLGTELLTVRSAQRAADVTVEALVQTLDNERIEVALSGQVSTASLETIEIPGAEPAVLGLPSDLGAESLAVVEAVAGLLGMTLQRVRLEEELSEVERARTALSARILEEGTRERSRIALQIHDDVLPYLAAAEIQADNVRSAMGGGDVQRADTLAGATRQAVHDGIARLREVLDALRRQIVVPGGLRPALGEALEELRLEQGITGHVHVVGELPPLPLAVEILVLETVRGCLTNVMRHAAAESVLVSLQMADGRLAVEVRDDGSGFDPAGVPEGHHGLVLMAQRVELARGHFSVRSAPGAGTTVQVEVPV